MEHHDPVTHHMPSDNGTQIMSTYDAVPYHVPPVNGTYGAMPHHVPPSPPPSYAPPPYHPTPVPTHQSTSPIYPHHHHDPHHHHHHHHRHHHDNHPNVYPPVEPGPWVVCNCRVINTPTAPPVPPNEDQEYYSRRRFRKATGSFASCIGMIIIIIAGYFIFQSTIRRSH